MDVSWNRKIVSGREAWIARRDDDITEWCRLVEFDPAIARFSDVVSAFFPAWSGFGRMPLRNEE